MTTVTALTACAGLASRRGFGHKARMPASPSPGGTSGFAVARVVWLGLLAASVIYLLVLQVVLPGEAPSPLPGAVAGVRTVLLGVALAETLAVWFVWQRLPAPRLVPAPGVATPRREAYPLLVVCWALAESIALFGFVTAFLARELGPGLVFFTWGIALLVITRPRAGMFSTP